MKKSLTIIFLGISLLFFNLTYAQKDNVYIIETEVGDIKFKLYPKKAPITVANFLKYVENKDFEGASFFRVVRMDNQPKDSIKIEVIQGSYVKGDKSLGAIPLERTNKTGLKHKNGTLSMARGKPDTASSSFFICINDQPSLDYGGMRNPDGQGFAAFGDVIDGMDVVKKIQAGEDKGQYLKTSIKINRIYKVK